MLTRFATAAAMLMALGAAASAKPFTLPSETNLRSAPGTTSDVVTLMPKGANIEVGDCDAGWCKVTYDGKEGFAIARNVGLAPRPAPRRYTREYYADDDGPVVYEDPGYVPAPPPVYYGPYPYGGPYWGPGWGWRGGWRRW